MLEVLGTPTVALADARRVLARYATRPPRLSLGDFSRLANDVAAWHAANLRGALPTMWKIDGAFKRFDSDGSGRIELKELTGALKALGLETDEAGAKAVLGRYERKEQHAGLDLAEFTRLVRDVVAWQETQTARNLASDAKCRAAFGKVDADQSGRVDGRELKKALEAMSEISGDWQHTREAIARYGHGGRTLMLGEFTTLVRAIMRGIRRNSAQLPDAVSTPQVRDLLAQQQTEAALARITPEQYRLTHSQYDTDGSGAIDVKELRGALESLGMTLDAAGAAEVLRKYDKPGLDLSEFSRLVHDVVAWQVGAGAPAPTAGAVAAAFGRADADNSGYVELGELRFALDALGLRVSADGASAILARYEHGSGVDVITFGELVRDVLAWHFEATREAATAAGRVEAAFGRFDTDGSGRIDAPELQVCDCHR